MTDHYPRGDSEARAFPIQPLGIGLPYMATLPADIYQSGLVDFIEITAETLCRPRQRAGSRTIELVAEKLESAQEACGAIPIVVHGVELSIGSATGWNVAYVDMLDAFQHHWPFLWHSEHLGFQT